MRLLKRKEINKRGCVYCTEYEKTGGVHTRNYCKRGKCPYHELDDFKSYNDYLKSTPDIDIAELLKNARKKQHL